MEVGERKIEVEGGWSCLHKVMWGAQTMRSECVGRSLNFSHPSIAAHNAAAFV